MSVELEQLEAWVNNPTCFGPKERAKLHAHFARVEADLGEALAILRRVGEETTNLKPGESIVYTKNLDDMRFLGRYGLIEIVSDTGDRVTARRKEPRDE